MINSKQRVNSPSTINVLGISLTIFDKPMLLNTIQRFVANQQKALVLSGNVFSFNLSYETPWLHQFFNRADIVRIDGAGIRLGAKILGHDTPPRMTWADFAWDLADLCEKNDFSLYFLGAKPGVADKASLMLKEKHPDLRFVGIQDGYFNKEKLNIENRSVVEAINKANPDILVVGFGMPLQETWLNDNWDDLRAKVTLTGGAVFDYLSGELQRAPKWMTDNGLEWLGRLFIEPRRLWKRYVVGNPLFLWRVLKQRLGLLKFD